MKNYLVKLSIMISLVFFLFNAAWAQSNITFSKGQTVYVPVYSHIYSGSKGHSFDLTVTLSIRNTNPKRPITISIVDYYNCDGKLQKRYIEQPIKLNALASHRFVIMESDRTGGSGANFIVKWKSEHKGNPPIIESIMIGTKSKQGISFTSRGQVIEASTVNDFGLYEK